MTVVTCTHECPLCGEGHYIEVDHNPMDRCRSCKRVVQLQKNENLTQQVKLLE